jgi:hypothetical protein
MGMHKIGVPKAAVLNKRRRGKDRDKYRRRENKREQEEVEPRVQS